MYKYVVQMNVGKKSYEMNAFYKPNLPKILAKPNIEKLDLRGCVLTNIGTIMYLHIF